MPPKSEKQRRFMHRAASSKKKAKEMGIPYDVAKEFADSDPGGVLPEKKQKRKRKKD